MAATVDAVQYEINNGPCLHAMRDGHMVRIEDTTDKARWPEFERRAACRGASKAKPSKPSQAKASTSAIC